MRQDQRELVAVHGNVVLAPHGARREHGVEGLQRHEAVAPQDAVDRGRHVVREVRDLRRHAQRPGAVVVCHLAEGSGSRAERER